MNFQKLIEFRYLRDVVITLAVKELNYSIPQALDIKVDQNLAFISDQANSLLREYSNCRSTIFPDLSQLFPTEDGTQYLPNKYWQNIERLLRQVGIQSPPSHPVQLHYEQIEAILGLKFENQRPAFQLSLASGMLGFMALRPGEVANLREDDIDIDSMKMYLRETKSQEPQRLPIHSDLQSSLTSYLKHLKPGEPLFIRLSKKQWDRKDVYLAVGKMSNHFGIEGIYPRRIRSTVASQMLRMGIPLKDVSALLRHKDIATTLRHYAGVVEMENISYALNQYQPTKPMPKSMHYQES
jgi:integrase